MPAEAIGPETGATFLTRQLYGVDARGMTFSWAFGAMRHLGGGSFYLLSVRDKQRQLLQGEGSYRLVVPSNVPVSQFWSLAVYDLATGAFIRDSAPVSRSSFVKDLQQNADGSTDLYFGTIPPDGKQSNWIPTRTDAFFVLFRFYGPQKAVFDKSWQLPDIEKLS